MLLCQGHFRPEQASQVKIFKKKTLMQLKQLGQTWAEQGHRWLNISQHAVPAIWASKLNVCRVHTESIFVHFKSNCNFRSFAVEQPFINNWLLQERICVTLTYFQAPYRFMIITLVYLLILLEGHHFKPQIWLHSMFVTDLCKYCLELQFCLVMRNYIRA